MGRAEAIPLAEHGEYGRVSSVQWRLHALRFRKIGRAVGKRLRDIGAPWNRKVRVCAGLRSAGKSAVEPVGLRRGKYDPPAPMDRKKRRNLACWAYSLINQARNDYLHGNPVNENNLLVKDSKRSLLDYAPALY